MEPISGRFWVARFSPRVQTSPAGLPTRSWPRWLRRHLHFSPGAADCKKRQQSMVCIGQSTPVHLTNASLRIMTDRPNTSENRVPKNKTKTKKGVDKNGIKSSKTLELMKTPL
ncbi:hypothetical protein VTH06DRAFT_2921 [Thermothelomyces fergusii]